MRLYSQSGVTQSGLIRITKPVSSLLVRTTRPIVDMGNEKVTIYVEKKGSNVEIATNIPLLDFMLLTSYGASAITSDGTFLTCCICEITPEFALKINEDEAIIVELTGLASAHTYAINGIEEPVTADAVVYFERKQALIGETRKSFDVSEYESICIQNYDAVDELKLTFDNGETVSYFKEEYKALSVDVDPTLQVTNTGTVVSLLASRMVFPLFGVDTIEILKDEAQQVVLICKDEKITQ